MQEKAKVVEVRGDVISVVPLDIEACIGCSNAECKKNGNVFQAVNSRKLAIVVGNEVRVLAPMKNQLWQAFLSVGVPLLLAVAAFASVAFFLPASGEGVRVGAALAALCAGMILTFNLHRIGSKDLPEIVEVY
jgi:hypothetical protein